MPALLLFLAQFALAGTGELRLTVVDPSGLPVESAIELSSTSRRLTLKPATTGRLVLSTHKGSRWVTTGMREKL